MRLNSGDTCPKTGAYKVINGHGKVINWVWVNKGEAMPTTQNSDYFYESES